MKQYIITKQFILGDRTFYKDKLLTVENFKAEQLKRLAARGFIKPIEKAAADYEEPESLDGQTGFLTPKNVNRLKMPKLLKYAAAIGVPNIDNTLPLPDLRVMVNGFIAKQGESEGGGEE